MGRIISLFAVVWIGISAAATADERSPVVVELFTSQGCSACPPADALLSKLARRDDVIALSLHVDYWDYIGWKDIFGDPAHTRRQKAYAREAGSHMIYTPQMVVAGAEQLAGHQPMELAELIQQHQAAEPPVKMQMYRRGGSVVITARAGMPLPVGAVLQLVRYVPQQTVTITRGENAGRTITYSNIVTSWNRLATWDGTGPFRMSFDISTDGPVVAIMQQPGPGPILAAARLR